MMGDRYVPVHTTVRYTGLDVPAPPAGWLYECGGCGWVVSASDFRCPNCGARLVWSPPEPPPELYEFDDGDESEVYKLGENE